MSRAWKWPVLGLNTAQNSGLLLFTIIFLIITGIQPRQYIARGRLDAFERVKYIKLKQSRQNRTVPWQPPVIPNV